MISIIPAMDIIDGKCVRLSKGDFSKKKTYNENPVETAKRFEAAGLKRLHLVDLEGARAGKVQHWKVLEAIANNTELVIDFSGGISTLSDVHSAFNAGTSLVTLGSIAVNQPETLLEWLRIFRAGKFILGADVKNERLMVKGWTQETNIYVDGFIEQYLNKGISKFFCTDISKDGMMQGPSVLLYQSIIQKFETIDLIASGGVTSLNDIKTLERIGCYGVIIGKALYEGNIKLEDLKIYAD